MASTDDTPLYFIIAEQLGFITPFEGERLETEWSTDPSLSAKEHLRRRVGQEKLDTVEAEVLAVLDGGSESGDGSWRPIDGVGGSPQLRGADRGLQELAAEQGDSHTSPTWDTSLVVSEGSARSITTESPGRYDYRGEQGRGAIGRVFVAHDQHIGRNIAVKELLDEMNNGSSTGEESSARPLSKNLTRFLREARVTAQLQHPSIVPVHEIGRRDDGSFYYTMKLVRGQTLLSAVKQRNGPEDGLKLLPHFRDLCQAIAYAHSRNVIHRDIKPSNVMIGEFGETVVLDWGLAKVRGEADVKSSELERGVKQLRDMTDTGTVDGSTIGTPAYMAPEQAAGDIEQIDELSDIYALGAVLYCILTGHPPYTGHSAYEIIQKVLNERFTPISERTHQPPAELAAIAEKALSRLKEDRFQSATELATEVESFMSGEKVAAYEYSSLELLQRFAGKNKKIIAAATLSLLVVLAALVFTSISYQKERDSNEKMVAAIKQEQIALTNEQQARKKERASTQVAHFHMAQGLDREASLLEAKRRYLGTRVYAAASLVNNPASPRGPQFDAEFVRTHPESVHLRAAAASKLYRTALLPTTRLSHLMSTEDAVYTVAYSPDGTLVASGGVNKTVRLWSADTGKLDQTLAGHTNTVSSVAFSPGGRTLVSAGLDGSVKLWEVATGRLIRTLEGHRERVWGVSYSPDGKLLATGGADREINIWDPATGELKKKLIGHTGFITSVAFAKDSKHLASTGAEMKIYLWDVVRAEIDLRIDTDDRIWSLAYSPDGSRIAAACFNNTVYEWESKSGKLTNTFLGHGDRVYAIAYAPDGKVLGSGGMDKTVRFWDSETGRLLLNLEGHAGIVMSMAFAPNGQHFVTGSYDKTLKIRSLDLRNQITVLRGHKDRVSNIAYSPRGEMIASAGLDETIRLWNTQTALELRVLRGHSEIVYAIAFTPDGRELISAGGDKSVVIWDVETGKMERVLTGHEDVVTCVAVSPDGTQIISGGEDRTVRGWNRETGQQLFVLKKHEAAIWAVVFSPDGRLFATGAYDKKIFVWDVSRLTPLHSLDGNDWISGLAFSPDSAVLFSSGKDAVPLAWDVTRGEIIRSYKGHQQWVNYARVSPGGEYLATSSDDRTVRLWSVSTGEPLLVIDTREGLAVDFSPVGQSIAVGDKNEIKVYPLENLAQKATPVELLTDTEKRAGLRLSGFMIEQMPPEKL